MQLTPIEMYVKKYRPNSSFDKHQQAVFKKMVQLQKTTEIEINSKQNTQQGFYLYGDVGRGKTMMTKMYFNSSVLEKKIHMNFHTFIQLIKDTLNKTTNKHNSITNAIHTVIPDAKLLFLDEFYLSNSKADKFLYKIINSILNQNIVLLITSNTPPEYIALQSILNLIKQKMIICILQGERDYRSTFSSYNKTTYYLTKNTSIKKMHHIFKSIIKNNQYRKDTIISRGKKITASKYCNGIAWFFFQQLCCRKLDTVDHEVVAKKYKTIFLIDIPILTSKNQFDIKRFSTLIDKLYENRTRLICLAAAIPEELCDTEAQTLEFKRTISRLHAMQTKRYVFSGNSKKNQEQ
ncbi:hypothetical protein CAXC1_120052 [Candidatus Xenohaliotis californiensis]|uniref:Cell division protein ZapE n=1 Tax=Candidatus Xenohaliotis californiensis TaxID=84677 RepID=A0ABM9N719_9RICK|nr:hypothetical protein CAXC1_120052 [Candidatus Xenohaliotis californiensis]